MAAISHEEMVREFLRAAGDEVPGSPTTPSLATLRMRRILLREEMREVNNALDAVEVAAHQDQPDDELVRLAHLAHELTDLLYVTYGTLLVMGVNATPVMREVHAANMRKFAGLQVKGVKVQKPADWVPANVQRVLQFQRDNWARWRQWFFFQEG